MVLKETKENLLGFQQYKDCQEKKEHQVFPVWKVIVEKKVHQVIVVVMVNQVNRDQ
jgi:hypothetical protein